MVCLYASPSLRRSLTMSGVIIASVYDVLGESVAVQHAKANFERNRRYIFLFRVFWGSRNVAAVKNSDALKN